METFVVRVWVPGNSGARPGPEALRGVVEHVRSGGTGTFGNVDELVISLSDFLGARAGVPPDRPVSLEANDRNDVVVSSPENALVEKEEPCPVADCSSHADQR
jgi:hypothetical protein